MKNSNKGIVPSWFNYNYARRGQEITSEYRLPWYYNMFNGLLVEMLMPDILHPILFNKKNEDGEANAKRDLATIMQGLVWTKDYLLKMPEEGHSNWIRSIKSVRNTHKAVQKRGYAKIESDNCLIDPKDYANLETNDDVWDAFEKDMAASDLLQESRGVPPTSSWPSCADSSTNCSVCESSGSGSSDCVETCTTTTTTDSEGIITIDKQCNKECSGGTNCHTCSWKAPNCYAANPKTFNCEHCVCNDQGKKCTNCTGCTNYERCHNFTIPLYNQQALGFVVFNLVGFAVLWPKEIGINVCDADLWAFNHLWAGILHGLGVEDECNLLLLPDIGSAREFYQGLFDSYILPTLFKLDKPTRFMMDNVFKGLKLLTGKTFTPSLLLCRFLRDFVKIPAKHVCRTMEPKDRLFDGIVNGMMLPQFMNDSNYRAIINKGIDDKFQSNAQQYFPDGECKDFETIASDCFA